MRKNYTQKPKEKEEKSLSKICKCFLHILKNRLVLFRPLKKICSTEKKDEVHSSKAETRKQYPTSDNTTPKAKL
jgi:hypothetical protein